MMCDVLLLWCRSCNAWYCFLQWRRFDCCRRRRNGRCGHELCSSCGRRHSQFGEWCTFVTRKEDFGFLQSSALQSCDCSSRSCIWYHLSIKQLFFFQLTIRKWNISIDLILRLDWWSIVVFVFFLITQMSQKVKIRMVVVPVSLPLPDGILWPDGELLTSKISSMPSFLNLALKISTTRERRDDDWSFLVVWNIIMKVSQDWTNWKDWINSITMSNVSVSLSI